MSDEILRMAGLRIVATTENGEVKTLVEGIDLSLHRGEVLGLIGESGAGKSTIGLAALAYTRPACAIAGGRILFAGEDVRAMDRTGRRKLRGHRIAYVAQSAGASFNPAKSLTQQVCEMPLRHRLMNRAAYRVYADGHEALVVDQSVSGGSERAQSSRLPSSPLYTPAGW